MRVVNNTPIPTADVRQMIRFVCPPGVTGFDVHAGITAQPCANKGRSYPDGHPAHGRSNWFVRVFVGHASRFPRRKGTAPPRPGKGYLPHPFYATQAEALVFILAHELRHLWQARVPRGRRVWGARGQFSERDADAYALRMLRAWRRSPRSDPLGRR